MDGAVIPTGGSPFVKLSFLPLSYEGFDLEEDIGKKLVEAMRNPGTSSCQESVAKAMELTKAYASSGSATHFSTVTKLFYDLFEMFETGRDPRTK